MTIPEETRHRMRRLFIGHTRFSVHAYSSGSFKATRKDSRFSEEEYTRWLYSDDRMAPRTELFIDESLPQLAESLEAAEDCDLVHIVHISDSLPSTYRRALEEAAQRHPFLHINVAPSFVAPSAPNKKVLNRVLKGRLPEDRLFAIYRLDDDDVLPINFFERMIPYVDPEHVGWRISFPHSYSALRTSQSYIKPWYRYFPKAAAGLVSIHKKTPDGDFLGLQTSPPKKGHLYLDTQFPTVLDSREPGFFQSRHVSQDSTLSEAETPFFSKMIKEAEKKPEADPSLLEKYYPHVFRRLHLRPQENAVSIADVEGAPLGTQGASFEPQLHGAFLLFGRTDPHSESAKITVSVALEQTDPEAPAPQAFMKRAGFSPDQASGYSTTVETRTTEAENDGASAGVFETVIEPAPGHRIGQLTLSGDDDAGHLEALATYSLT